MKREAPFSKVWKWTVQGSPLWWCLGLNMGIYHLAALAIFFKKISEKTRNAEGIYVPATVFPVFAIFCIYGMSIFIHRGSGDGGRLIAAFYNLSVWGMGILLIVGLSNLFSTRHVSEVAGYCKWPAWFAGILSMAMLVVWLRGSQTLVIPTPMAHLTEYAGNATLVENSVIMKPLIRDWFASLSRPRYNVFSPYPTAAGGVLMIFLALLITHQGLGMTPLRRIPFFVLIGLTAWALIMTLSRTTLIGLIFAMFLVAIVGRKGISLWLLAAIFLFSLLLPFMERLIDIFLGLREGSNTARMNLYRASLDQLNGVDWILGVGLKSREGPMDYPLGSHSTFVGMIFKSGFCGFLALVTFQASLLIRWYHLKKAVLESPQNFVFWRGLGWIFIAMSLWMLTEDIDAPQFLAFLYFSMIGIFEGFRRSLLRHE